MSNPQPTIQHLTHRLARCPREFLEEPRQAKRPGIHVDAVVADLLMEIGGTSHPPLRFARFEQPGPGQRNHMRLVLVAAWLLYDPCFRNRPHFVSPLSQWLTVDLERLSELVDAHAFVDDADRREELSRLALAAVKILPAGESKHYARDRLTTFSSVERERLIRETRAQMQHAEELRRKMNEQRAREAAVRYTRE